MSYVTWKMDYVPFVDEAWDTTPETLTDYYDPLITVNLGDAKDSFSFKIRNPHRTNDHKFNPQDKITVSRVLDSTSFSGSDVKLTGSIKNSPDDYTSNADRSRVEGFNYTESIFSAIVFLDATGLSIPVALQLALGKAGNRGVFQAVWDTGFNPTTKVDGSAFPVVQERWFNWTLQKIFEQYSSSKYTQDGAYRYYVTNDNKVRWFAVADTSKFTQYTFNSTTDEVLAIKTDKDVTDVRNHIIIKGGRAPDNKAIQMSVVDYASVNKNGRRYLFVTSKVNLADDIIKLDTEGSSGRYPASYAGFTTQWKYYKDGLGSSEVVEGITCTDGQYVTGISSDTEYNAVVRRHTENTLLTEASEILYLYKNGKLKVDITTRAGTKAWYLGDLIRCTIPQVSATSKVLRITEIQYSTTTDIFSLVEDEGTI